jgi:hypothetical protein
VRLALEERKLLPGDPNRVFRSFETNGRLNDEAPMPRTKPAEEPKSVDPTSIAPQEGKLFSIE